MAMKLEVLALFALGPVLVGPLASPGETITARLCGGGTISIPVGQDREQMPADTCFKGCHAGACRKRSLDSNSHDEL